MNRADYADYDIAVLGSGLGASVLAAVLARNGLRVIMIDEETHPRLAIGEMVGRYSALLLEVLAERYGVPELTRIASFEAVSASTGGSSGAERCHSFVYHRRGMPHDPAELTQLSPPRGVPPEPLLYRPDVDAYLCETARGYGAELHAGPGAGVVTLEAGSGLAEVTTRDGRRVRARFLVDAGGRESALAERLGLREKPTRLTAGTRSLYTHMAGVRPMDEVVSPAGAYRLPVPLGQGSAQHLFDGGYLWVFPFGNHPDAPNRTASVGLTLDAERFPRGEDPAAEFAAFLRDHPTLAAMFRTAKPVRPWVSTGPQQCSAAATVGDGWCLIGEAAGYVDPFLNRSLISTLEVVNVLTWRLLEAAREGDFAAARFEAVDRVNRRVLEENDALVSMVIAATRDHALWKAVLLVLEAGLRYGQFHTQIALGRWRATGSDAELKRLEDMAYFGSPFPGHEGYHRLFKTAAAECAEVRAGKADAREAAGRVVAALREADFVPHFFGLSDPARRVLRLNPLILLRMLLWSRRGAPPDIGPLVRTAISTILRERRESRRRHKSRKNRP